MNLFFNVLFMIFTAQLSYAAPCLICFQEADKSCGQCKQPLCRSCIVSPLYREHREQEKKQDAIQTLSQALIKKTSTLPRKGDGLFAKTLIPRGTVVALYAGTLHCNPDPFNFEALVQQDEYDRNFCAQKVDHACFTKGARCGYVIGDPDTSELGLFAQSVQDPSITAEDVSFFKTLVQENIPAQAFKRLSRIIEEYCYQFSQQPRHNVVLVDHKPFSKELPFPYLVSTRDIAADEEIFHSYGLNYWAAIVYTNAMRKGLFLQSVKILRGMSEGLEKAGYRLGANCTSNQPHRQKMSFKVFQQNLEKLQGVDLTSSFAFYQSENTTRDLLSVYAAAPALVLCQQIPGLLIDMEYCLLYMKDFENFKKILDKIDFDRRMQAIAELPEESFFQGAMSNQPASLSKELLADLLEESKVFSVCPFQFYIPKSNLETGKASVLLDELFSEQTPAVSLTSEQEISHETLKKAFCLPERS